MRHCANISSEGSQRHMHARVWTTPVSEVSLFSRLPGPRLAGGRAGGWVELLPGSDAAGLGAAPCRGAASTGRAGQRAAGGHAAGHAACGKTGRQNNLRKKNVLAPRCGDIRQAISLLLLPLLCTRISSSCSWILASSSAVNLNLLSAAAGGCCCCC